MPEQNPPEAVLDLAVAVATCLLENGSETYRSEDAAEIVCAALGGYKAECFATPTNVIVSIEDAQGKNYTKVRRIKSRGMNLEKVAALNRLTYKIISAKLNLADAQDIFIKIKEQKGYPFFLRLIAAAIGTGTYALFFDGGWRDALVAAFLGILVLILNSYLTKKKVGSFFTNISGGALASVLSIMLYRMGFITSPVSAIMGTIMLLVPGLAITNAIRDSIAGDLVAGVARASDAFIAATALSIGASSGFAIMRFIGLDYNFSPLSTTPTYMSLLWAAASTLGFAMLFGMRVRNFLSSIIGAALGYFVYLIAYNFSSNAALFASAMAISLWAEVAAIIEKKPATIFIVAALLPLVPGSGMFTTMLHAVRGDYMATMIPGLQTMQAALAIAAGLAVASTISRLLAWQKIARKINTLLLPTAEEEGEEEFLK